jgi:hypothetical protein
MSNEIIVFTSDPIPDNDFKLLDEGGGNALPLNTVKANLQNFIENLSALLPALNPSDLPYQLDEFTVAAGINGKGKVGFLGTGSEAGASATLSLTFKRVVAPVPPRGTSQSG